MAGRRFRTTFIANPLWRLLVGGVLLWCTATSLWAAQQLPIHVQDQQGKPLYQAIVELKQAKQQPAKGLPLAVMDQVNKLFKPTVLLIHKGQKVSFPNSDNIRHHVYSFSPAHPFELKLYAGKHQAPVEFDKSGVVVLGCNIHDSMVGYIYVANSAKAVMTDDNGNARLLVPGLSDDTTLLVWHRNYKPGPEQRMQVQIAELKQRQGRYVVILPTEPPQPRDTFEAKFRH